VYQRHDRGGGRKGRVLPRRAAGPAGPAQAFAYTLRPKYPIKAKAPTALVYEYYAPANRAASRPVQLVAEGKRTSAATAALRAGAFSAWRRR
jgi:hypothetical protein